MKKVSKHFKKVALISAIGLSFGFFQSAIAATATGTITITGNSVGTCTIANAAVNFGSVAQGAAGSYNASVNLSLNCVSGTNWSLTAPTTNPLSVGSNINNKVVLVNAMGQNVGLTPEVGVGTSLPQNLSWYVQISNNTGGGIVGLGAITGTIPLTLTF